MPGEHGDHGDDYTDDTQSYDSFFASLRSYGEDKLSLDFLSLVSQLSISFRSQQLTNFSTINCNAHERSERRLGAGSVFVASQQMIRRSALSTELAGRLVRVDQHIATKKCRHLFERNGLCRPHRQHDLRMFIREIQILTHLRQHPNIIALLGVGWHFDQFHEAPIAQPRMILELADSTLTTFVKSSQRPTKTKLELLVNVASGLRVIHECGLVHGDVKPGNVLIQRQPTFRDEERLPAFIAKISDFSQSRLISSDSDYQSLGTYGYRAPELERQETIHLPFALDVYAFGVTIWNTIFDLSKLPQTMEHQLGRFDLPTQLRTEMEGVYQDRIDNEQRSLLYDLLQSTLGHDPRQRDLNKASNILEAYIFARSNIRLVEFNQLHVKLNHRQSRANSS